MAEILSSYQEKVWPSIFVLFVDGIEHVFGNNISIVNRVRLVLVNFESHYLRNRFNGAGELLWIDRCRNLSCLFWRSCHGKLKPLPEGQGDVVGQKRRFWRFSGQACKREKFSRFLARLSFLQKNNYFAYLFSLRLSQLDLHLRSVSNVLESVAQEADVIQYKYSAIEAVMLLNAVNFDNVITIEDGLECLDQQFHGFSVPWSRRYLDEESVLLLAEYKLWILQKSEDIGLSVAWLKKISAWVFFGHWVFYPMGFTRENEP